MSRSGQGARASPRCEASPPRIRPSHVRERPPQLRPLQLLQAECAEADARLLAVTLEGDAHAAGYWNDVQLVTAHLDVVHDGDDAATRLPNHDLLLSAADGRAGYGADVDLDSWPGGPARATTSRLGASAARSWRAIPSAQAAMSRQSRWSP